MGVKTELGAGVCRVKGEGGTTFPSVIQVGGVVVGDDWWGVWGGDRRVDRVGGGWV